MIGPRLFAFELFVGLPTALSRLRAALGTSTLIRVLLRFGWRSATRDPLAALGKADSAKARFSRRQLRPVLLLDEALAAIGVAPERRLEILSSVVAETGARFIAFNLKPPSRAAWEKTSEAERRAFVVRVTEQFGNAEMEILEDPSAEVAFDVSFCHFAAMTRALGRPELAPLFCKADSVYFARPESPIRLRRDHTIAGGDERCTFRLGFDE